MGTRADFYIGRGKSAIWLGSWDEFQNMMRNRKERMVIQTISVAVLAGALLAGCASGPVSVTTEHHGHVTVIHHRRKVSNGTVDRIEAVDAKGVVTQAEVHVFDIGRLPDGNGGMHEAHRFYQLVSSSHPDLSLPKKVSSGPRTIFTPPNSMPLPNDQRINDAVTEAQEAKKKLEDAAADIKNKLDSDNNLRGELQEVEDKNRQLTEQLNASMSTGSHKPAPTEAEKAADQLEMWGKQKP